MGYSSQSGQIGLKTQTTLGTYATPATTGVFVKTRGGSLGINRDLLVPDPEIGGGRDTVDAYLGGAVWSGDIDFYVRMEMLSTLLKACLGSAATVTTTGVSTHTITPLDSATLPYLSVEERIGSGLETYNYTDTVVNTLHLESDANGYLMGTAGLIAAKQTAGNTATVSPTISDASPLYVGTNITVTYNAVSMSAKSFSLDINNNFDSDDFRLGSFFIGDLTAKAREVTASFTVRHQDSALWRQAAYGVPAATAVGGVTTKNQLIITITSYEDIVSGTPPTKYSLTITIPKFIFEPFAFEPSGDDYLENDAAGRALRPAIGTPIATAVIKAGNAAIA